MIKLAKKLSLTLGGLVLSAGTALAQQGQGFFNTSPTPPPSVVSTDTLGGTVTTIINYGLGILGLVAVAFIIYAGVLMVTAGGDEDQVGKGKKIITTAIIGIIVIILSYSIVTFVTGVI